MIFNIIYSVLAEHHSQPIPPGLWRSLQNTLAFVDTGNAVAPRLLRMGPFFHRQCHACVYYLGYHFPICKPSLFLKFMMHLIFKPVIFLYRILLVLYERVLLSNASKDFKISST
jgi:hypothetical protein